PEEPRSVARTPTTRDRGAPPSAVAPGRTSFGGAKPGDARPTRATECGCSRKKLVRWRETQRRRPETQRRPPDTRHRVRLLPEETRSVARNPATPARHAPPSAVAPGRNSFGGAKPSDAGPTRDDAGPTRATECGCSRKNLVRWREL